MTIISGSVQFYEGVIGPDYLGPAQSALNNDCSAKILSNTKYNRQITQKFLEGGTITLPAELSFSGADVYVSQDLHVSGTTFADGDATVTDDLTVLGGATITGNVTANANVVVNGGLDTVGYLHTHGELTTDGPTYVQAPVYLLSYVNPSGGPNSGRVALRIDYASDSDTTISWGDGGTDVYYIGEGVTETRTYTVSSTDGLVPSTAARMTIVNRSGHDQIVSDPTGIGKHWFISDGQNQDIFWIEAFGRWV